MKPHQTRCPRRAAQRSVGDLRRSVSHGLRMKVIWVAMLAMQHWHSWAGEAREVWVIFELTAHGTFQGAKRASGCFMGTQQLPGMRKEKNF